MAVASRTARRFRRFLFGNDAVSAPEYAILVGLVAVAAITVIAAFSGDIGVTTMQIGTNLQGTAATIGR